MPLRQKDYVAFSKSVYSMEFYVLQGYCMQVVHLCDCIKKEVNWILSTAASKSFYDKKILTSLMSHLNLQILGNIFD